MSVLPPKADMCGDEECPLWPEADIGTKLNFYLVGAGNQRLASDRFAGFGQDWGTPKGERLRSKPKPMHPVFFLAPTNNGTRFPGLVSSVGPEGKRPSHWHHVSSLY